MSLLLALTMVPAAGIQSVFADEPADRPVTTGGDVPLEGPAEGTGLNADGSTEEANGPVTATVREDGTLVAEGLVYKSEGNGAVLVGFEDGASLEREVAVPERLTDGALEYTVKGVDVAEGQTAPNVLSLVLPQTVEDVDAKSLAAAMPALARVSVDGRGGAYSSANGMLFKQESVTASSDGSTTRIANRELVWAPPAMVIARVPGTCKTVASGAFTDDAALETVMVFSIVESVAKAERDENGNITKEGAFTDEQVSKVNIVTPMETLVYPEGDRISTDAFLAEDAPLNEKHIPWCDCGFSMDRFTVGIPYGSTSLAVAVPEDGRVGTPEITIGHYTDHPEWDPKEETGEPENGLVFEYKADMTVSVTWKGDKAAVPSHLELPAYVIENGVKTAVTEVVSNAFEGATQLESVVIPEGITTIGESAFAGCANLEDIDYPLTAKADNSACGAIANAIAVEMTERNDEGEPLALDDEGDSVLKDAPTGLQSYSSTDGWNTYIVRILKTTGFSSAVPSAADSDNKNELDSDETAYLEFTTSTRTNGLGAATNRNGLDFFNDSGVGFCSCNAAGGVARTWAVSFTIRSLPGYRFAGASLYATGQTMTPNGIIRFDPTPDPSYIIVVPFFDKDDNTFKVGDTTYALDAAGLKSWLGSENYITKAVDDLANYTTTSNLQRDYVAKNDISSYDTNAKLNTAFDKKIDKSEFGAITYANENEFTSKAVMPKSYRAGGVPAIPEPEKDGCEFAGWTWDGQTAPTTDASKLTSLFSAGNKTVTLTANWTEPRAEWFFTEDAPFSASGADSQTHTIAVRLTSSAGTVDALSFTDNSGGLLKGDALGSVKLEVKGGDGTFHAAAWNDASSQWTVSDAGFAAAAIDDGYGVYVRITVPTSAVAADKIASSFTPGSYVASLVKMNYNIA